MSIALSKFLSVQKLSITRFSEEIGVSYASMHRILNDKQFPSPDVMVKIYVVTKGAVTPNDFYDLPALFEGDQPDLFGAVSSPKIFPESRITPSGLDCQESCQPMGAGC